MKEYKNWQGVHRDAPATQPLFTPNSFVGGFLRKCHSWRVFSTDKADDIVGAIKYEVTENTVFITWQEPVAPNGMIILYEVNYKRLGDTEVKNHTVCPHMFNRTVKTVLLY